MDDAEYYQQHRDDEDEWDPADPPVRVAIDPNIRLRNNETFVGLEDANGPVDVGDEVRVWVPESTVAGNGEVTGVDEERGLVYLAVDWQSLRTETERREIAYAHRGQVAPKRSEKRRLDSIYSVRFEPGDVDTLRAAAKAAGVSTSELIRHAALVHARRQLAPIPAHSCGGIGCRWCDPRETVSVVVAGPLLSLAG